MAEQAKDSSAKPAFVARLVGKSAEDRATALATQHVDYVANAPSWDVLLDAFEGRGGFLDGSYLWPYPREDAEAFGRRQSMARYHNYLETLVDLYVRFIFTQGVKRDSKSEEYNQWLDDVDGAGTDVNEFLKRYVAMSLVCGHAAMLVDKTTEEAEGPSKAEEMARVIASIFPATSIIDWRFDQRGLCAIKMLEASAPRPIDEPESGMVDGKPVEKTDNVLMWDVEGFGRFDSTGELLGSGTPDIGMVPVVILRPKPSQTSLMLGRPLVSNANVVRALFNRASEEDEVLRTQAFSLLTVSLHPEGDVDQTKASLGNTIGTAKAIVVKGDIDYKTPDQNVPQAIRDNIAYLVQEMYRAAHVRFSRDSLAAQSGDAIRLQYAELNEMLQGLSRALAQAEREMARAWFAWTTPTAEAAQAAFDAADVSATYPDEFFLDALINDLEAWMKAIEMDLGATMARRIKKRAARRVDPDMTADEMKEVDDEIDGMDDDEVRGKDQLLPGAMPGMPGAVATDTGDPEKDLMRTDKLRSDADAE